MARCTTCRRAWGLLASLVLVIENIRAVEKLEKPLADMGRRHVGYGTQPEHYPVVRDTLVSVMADMAGDAWNDQLSADWTGALDFVASAMLAGAEQAQQVADTN